MSLGASIALSAILGLVIVLDLLSIVKRVDQKLEQLPQDSSKKNHS